MEITEKIEKVLKSKQKLKKKRTIEVKIYNPTPLSHNYKWDSQQHLKQRQRCTCIIW